MGIASYEDMKARTMAVARGEQRIAPDEPKVWFTSTESFAKVLSAGNRELLRIIAEKAPGSLDELARNTGKAKSNLSRTLRTMEGYGLVNLERGERGRVTPRVMHDRVELDLQLTLSQKASCAMTAWTRAGRTAASPSRLARSAPPQHGYGLDLSPARKVARKRSRFETSVAAPFLTVLPGREKGVAG